MNKPTTQGEKNTIDAAKQVLQNQDNHWTSRQQLATQIEQEIGNVSETSAKAHLSTFRNYLEQNGFETKEKAEPRGTPTVYWRLKK